MNANLKKSSYSKEDSVSFLISIIKKFHNVAINPLTLRGGHNGCIVVELGDKYPFVVNHNPTMHPTIHNGGIGVQLKYLKSVGYDKKIIAATTHEAPKIDITIGKKKPIKFYTAHWEGVVGHRVKQHFLKKIGVGDSLTLSLLGIQPNATFPNDPNWGYLRNGYKLFRPEHQDSRLRKIQNISTHIHGEERCNGGGVLFIFESENDADLCYISSNINTIALGGASSSSPEKVNKISSIASNYEKVYICFDNDEAGWKGADMLWEKMERGVGIADFGRGVSWFLEGEFSHIPQRAGIKDIGRFFQFLRDNSYSIIDSHNIINRLMCHIINTQNYRKRDEQDMFAPVLSNYATLQFDQYLGDGVDVGGIRPASLLRWEIFKNQRTILQSPAGTGKTWFFIDFIKYGWLENCGLKRCIFIVPNQAIAQQVTEDFENGGIDSQIVYQYTNDEELDMAGDKVKILICVVNSAPKVRGLVKDALVVFDEYHIIATNADFRYKELKDAFKMCFEAPKVVFISATPLHLFATNVSPFFGFRLVECIPNKTNKIIISPKIFDGKIEDIFWAIEDNTPSGEGIVAYKIDNTKILDALVESNEKRGISTATIYSRDKEKNPHYNGVMKGGLLEEGVEQLGFTCLLEAGVSIKNHCKLLVIIDPKSWIDVIQTASRFRQNMQTGANMVLNVWVICKTEEEGGWETDIPPYCGKGIVDIYNDFIYSSTMEAGRFNSWKDKGEGLVGKVRTDGGRNLEVNEAGVWQPSLIKILHQLYKSEIKCNGFSLNNYSSFWGKMKVVDSRIDVEKFANLEAGGGVLSEYKQAKEEEKRAKSELEKLMIDSPLLVLRAIAYLSKNPRQKRELKTIFSLPPKDDSLLQFVIDNRRALRSGTAGVITKEAIFWGKRGDDIVDIAQRVATLSSQSLSISKERAVHKERKEKHRAEKKGGDKLSGLERTEILINGKIEHKIKERLRSIKAGRRAEFFTGEELVEIVSSYINGGRKKAKPVPPQLALIRVQHLFRIVRKERGEDRKLRYFLEPITD